MKTKSGGTVRKPSSSCIPMLSQVPNLRTDIYIKGCSADYICPSQLFCHWEYKSDAKKCIMSSKLWDELSFLLGDDSNQYEISVRLDPHEVKRYFTAFYCVDFYPRKERKKICLWLSLLFFFPFSILFQRHRLTLDHGWHFGPGSCSTAPTASELTRGNKPADSSFTGWKPCVRRAPPLHPLAA